MIEELTIYLCGPINDRSDSECVHWRMAAARLWPGRVLDPMRRDYREILDSVDVRSLVELDLDDINNSHGLLVNFDRPSVGTSMEVFYAKHVRKLPVVVWDEHGQGVRNPWLVHHCDSMVKTLDIAVARLASLISR